MRKILSDKGVAALKRRTKAYSIPDPELRGHWIRIQPSGHKTFWTIARDPNGKQIWTHVSPCDVMTIEAAREQARTILQRVRAGLPAVESVGETFDDVYKNWLERVVIRKGFRSCTKIENYVQRYLPTQFRERIFTTIRKGHVIALLDKVEDSYGAAQAETILGIVRQIMNWYATRTDDYTSPLSRGMSRYSQKTNARERILNDDEIRAVWAVASKSGFYGAFVKMLLLTAQRREKMRTMKWTDLSPMEWTDDNLPEWTLPTAPREKGNIQQVRLPKLAADILTELPRYKSNPFVFAGGGIGGTKPFGAIGGGKTKHRFDAKLPTGMPRWTLHDLRRTARSLMSRAGVLSEHAEKVMGHTKRGSESIYDRHKYFDEKTEALRKLAGLIDIIVNPRADNVKPLKEMKGKSR
jgi:integrase